MKASKEQVVEILTFALRKLHLLNFNHFIISNSKFTFDKDKGSNASNIDLIYKLDSSPYKLRLVMSFKEGNNGNLFLSGNALQSMQLLGAHNSMWCNRLNNYLHRTFHVYPEDQFFAVNQNLLLYVFKVMYSEHRRNDIETLTNDIGAFIMTQIQYACLPMVEKCDMDKEKAWPQLIDVDAI